MAVELRDLSQAAYCFRRCLNNIRETADKDKDKDKDKDRDKDIDVDKDKEKERVKRDVNEVQQQTDKDEETETDEDINNNSFKTNKTDKYTQDKYIYQDNNSDAETTNKQMEEEVSYHLALVYREMVR